MSGMGRTVVGMSGGLDSSLAAHLMIEAGYEVIGVFLHLWSPQGGAGRRCCSPQDLDDARRVADHLQILLHEECHADEFFAKIFLPTLHRYAGGMTPNPCVVCNEQIKLVELVRLADELEAEVVATGHYGRLYRHRAGLVRLLRGCDSGKDQSYFLHRLSQRQLSRLRLPLGEMTKAETRRLAEAVGLPVLTKAESQELCFVPEGVTYAELYEQWLPERVRPGAIVDTSGRCLGSHDGLHRYTVGQRRGLGISAPEPLYVLELRPDSGTVVVGSREQLLVGELRAEELSWVAGEPPAAAFECTVQVRSRHVAVPAAVEVNGNEAIIRPAEPISAPAPGQAAVFYNDEEVLGGGWISRPRHGSD